MYVLRHFIIKSDFSVKLYYASSIVPLDWALDKLILHAKKIGSVKFIPIADVILIEMKK